MGESVILSTPLLLILLGLALGLCLYDRHYRATRGAFTLISAFLAIAACGYSLILGAQAREIITVLLAFLALNLEGWK